MTFFHNFISNVWRRVNIYPFKGFVGRLSVTVFILNVILNLGLLSALDIVEVNPYMGTSEEESHKTVETALRITEACLGKHRSGYITKRQFEYAKPAEQFY